MDSHFIFHKIKVPLIFLFPFCKGLITALEELILNSTIHIYMYLLLSCFHLLPMMILRKYTTITAILTLEVSEQTLQVSLLVWVALDQHSQYRLKNWRNHAANGTISGPGFFNIKCVQSMNIISCSLYLDFVKNRWMTLSSMTCIQE